MRTTKPRTIQKATELLAELTEELILTKGSRGDDSGVKRKFVGNKHGKKGSRFGKSGKSYSSGGNKARRTEGRSDGDKAACQQCNRIHSRECKMMSCEKCDRGGMPHVMVVSRLFATPAGLKAISGLIVQVSIVPPLLIRGK
jgi:hypothetical protein